MNAPPSSNASSNPGAHPDGPQRADIAAGRRLIDAGLLHPEHARTALDMAHRQRQPLTAVLLEHGLVQREQLLALGLLTPGPAPSTGHAAPPAMATTAAGSSSDSTPGAPPDSSPDTERTLLASSGRRARLPEPGDRIDNATVIRELGRGGMGAVYEVAVGETRFALKLVLTESEIQLERFEREARAAAAVDRHPNIVSIHRYDRYGGRPYILLDFIEGEGLDQRLERDPPPLETSLEWIATIADALAFVHERDILHRDLKPANIMIRARDEAPLLSDFGLARAGDSEGLTKTGQVLGTPSYMAPEQADGDRHAFGPHTDTWALGVILYELATGRKPFEGETAIQLARAIMLDEPTPPDSFGRELPPGLAGVIRRALEKEPAHRYGDAAELARDLRRILRGDHVDAAAGPLTRVRRRVVRRFGGRVAALGLLALVALPVTLVAGAVVRSRNAALEQLRLDVARARERCAPGLARLDGEPLAAALCAAVLHHDGRFSAPPEHTFERIRGELAPISSALTALDSRRRDAAFQLVPAERRPIWGLLARAYEISDPLAADRPGPSEHRRFERGALGDGPLDERRRALEGKVSGRLQGAADLALGLLLMRSAESPSAGPKARRERLLDACRELERPIAELLETPDETPTERPDVEPLSAPSRLILPVLIEARARAAVIELLHPLAELSDSPRVVDPNAVPALAELDRLATVCGDATPFEVLNARVTEAAQRLPPGPEDPAAYWPEFPVRSRPDLVWRTLGRRRLEPRLRPPIAASGLPPIKLAKYYYDASVELKQSDPRRPDPLNLISRMNDLVTLARIEQPDLVMPRWIVGAAVSAATDAIADPEGLRLGLKISIEMARHGIAIGLLAGKRTSLEQLHELGAFGQEIDAAPDSPFPRFWRGMRHPADTRDIQPEQDPKQLERLIRRNEGIIHDLEFALRSEQVRGGVRGVALHRLAIALNLKESLERKKTEAPQDEALRWKIIGLHQESLKYPSPHPDEIYRKVASRILDKVEPIVPANTRSQRAALTAKELETLRQANRMRLRVILRRCPSARDVGEDHIPLPPPAELPPKLDSAVEPMAPTDYYDRMSQVCGQVALGFRLSGDPTTGLRWARRGMAFDKLLKRGGNSDSYWEALRCLLDLDREDDARALFYEIRDDRRAGRIQMKLGNLGQLSRVFEAWGGEAILDWK